VLLSAALALAWAAPLASAAPAGPAPAAYDRPDAEAVRQAAREILAGSRFKRGQTLSELLAEWLGRLLERISLAGLGEAGQTIGWILYVLMWGVLALLLLLVIRAIWRHVRGRQRRQGVPSEATAHFRSLRAKSYEELCELMRQRLAQGQVRVAIGLLMAALLCWLDQRKVVRWEQGKTHGEYAREFAGGPTGRSDFRKLVRAVDERIYSGAACSAGDVQTLWQAVETIQHHVGQRA